MRRDRETTDAYRARKHAELALLRARLGEGAGPPPSTVAEVVEAKRALRARLLAQAAEEAAWATESNLSGGRAAALGPGALRWDYQRYDAQWRQKPFAALAYPLERAPPTLSIGLAVGSGMAAVSAALGALDQLAGDGARLLVPEDAYFETLFFVHRYLRKLRVAMALDEPRPGDVLYLDSFCARDRAAAARESWSSLAAVVVDTTCWDAGSARIDRVVARCVEERVPCVLVRSHLKLDQLGVEYFRFGSIVILLGRPAERAAIARASLLRSKMLNAVTVHGGTLEPIGLFPLHGPSLRALNEGRNRRMRINNRYAARRLARRLADSITRVVGYHHGCFFVLRPFLDTVWATTKRCAELAALLRARGLEARVAASFGYDFIAVTRVAGIENSRAAIRVALPDLPLAMVEIAIDAIAEYAGPLAAEP